MFGLVLVCMYYNATNGLENGLLRENPRGFFAIEPKIAKVRGISLINSEAMNYSRLKEAIINLDYELYQKIREVKTSLGFVNGYRTNRDYVFILETEQTMWDVDVRYFLKKEGDLLKLYTTNDTNEEFHDCDASLKINDGLSKRDVIELLEIYFEKWRTYGGLPRFRKEGLLDEKEFYAIIDSINEKKELKSPFIYYLEKVNLDPIPDGKNENQWLAKCPYSKGKHHMMVSTKNDTYGCGWCRKKGNQRDLENYLETQTL